jgi:hypothetical protein
MSELIRKVRDADITLTTAASSATTLDMRDMAAAVAAFGTMATSVTSLELHVSNSSTGTFRKLYKADGTAATLTLSPSTSEGRAYYLPDEAFGVEFVKLVAGHTAAVGITGVVMFKS